MRPIAFALPRALTAFALAAGCVVLAPGAAAARGGGSHGWLAPVSGPLLRSFSVGVDRFAAGQHRGVDLAAPAGTPVLSACAGRVSFAGRVPRGGQTVSVRCGPLVATLQHLAAVRVARGRLVARGAPIASVGRAQPRPHVHLGARDAASGRYLDPLSLLGGTPGTLPPAPAPRQAPLGPAPAPRLRPALRPRPAPRSRPALRPALRPRPAPPVGAPALRPAPRPAAPAPPGRAPWPVWLGLALVALGLPLGGLRSARRRRRRAGALAARPRTAS